jgi:hypothetical protein
MQINLAKRLLLMQPAAFGFNNETASTNSFQQQKEVKAVQAKALSEFNRLAEALKTADIDFDLLIDNPKPRKPDAIFLNNWFSTHVGGKLVIYPMATPSRQAEITDSHLRWLATQGYATQIDLRTVAEAGQYLEGTGSLVFDHAHGVVYAGESARTSAALAQHTSALLGYKALLFNAKDHQNKSIYHTNVWLSVSPTLAIACFKALADSDEAALLAALLERNGRRVIAVSMEQMAQFCCNALVVQCRQGQAKIVLSETAWSAFTPYQQLWIAERAEPVVAAIPTIEQVGGGSVRCMLAELF